MSSHSHSRLSVTEPKMLSSFAKKKKKEPYILHILKQMYPNSTTDINTLVPSNSAYVKYQSLKRKPDRVAE